MPYPLQQPTSQFSNPSTESYPAESLTGEAAQGVALAQQIIVYVNRIQASKNLEAMTKRTILMGLVSPFLWFTWTNQLKKSCNKCIICTHKN